MHFESNYLHCFRTGKKNSFFKVSHDRESHGFNGAILKSVKT